MKLKKLLALLGCTVLVNTCAGCANPIVGIWKPSATKIGGKMVTFEEMAEMGVDLSDYSMSVVLRSDGTGTIITGMKKHEFEYEFKDDCVIIEDGSRDLELYYDEEEESLSVELDEVSLRLEKKGE